MRKLIVLIILVINLVPVAASADWLIYHKPAFEGQILDGETKRPIEGAVVVALYNKRTMGLGAGTLSSVINVREALTNKQGKFKIPSYTTIIQPFSWEETVTFIIYKPGYISLRLDLGKYFTGEETRTQEGSLWWSKDLKFRIREGGIVELPKVRSNNDRLNSIPPRDDEIVNDAKELMKLISKEREYFSVEKRHRK